MDTPVTIAIVAPSGHPGCAAAADRAFAWFAEVEARCSRFDPTSELRRLADRPPGEPVSVSPLLFEAVAFACAVAERSGGAFDPTIGARQQARGLVRNYRTGRAEPWRAPGSERPHAAERRAATSGADSGDETVAMAAQLLVAQVLAGEQALPASSSPAPDPTWRDIALDRQASAVTLRRPLLLDLGAVAKGMAIDLAARELAAAHPDFLVEAGGDLFAAGRNADGQPWRVGIRHPRAHDAYCAVLAVSGAAVCTSGDYARPTADGGHHILDPRGARSAEAATACTVLAPSAMLADALATAAFVLGPTAGLRWLRRQRADGLIVGADLQIHTTPGLRRRRVS